MSNSMEQGPRIADELGKHRLAPPSLDLHDRVLRAARQALATRERVVDDIPWKLPVFRFAVCLVTAVLLIFTGNLAGDYVIAQWQTSPASLDQSASDPTAIAGSADSSFMVRLATSDPARSQRVAREQFLNYRRQVQELSGSCQ
jgi:hypothetical protein